MLAILWWAWVGYAWLTSVVDPEEGIVRARDLRRDGGAAGRARCACPTVFGDGAAIFAVRLRDRPRRPDRAVRHRQPRRPGAAPLGARPGVSTTIGVGALIGARPFADGALQGALWVARARARHGRPAVHRHRGLAAGPAPLRRAPRPDRPHRARRVDRRHRRRAPRPSSTPASSTAAVLGIAVAAALWWLYFDVVALVAARRLANAAAGQGAQRDRPRLLLLPALADGRRHRAARARHQEDARPTSGRAEARPRLRPARRHARSTSSPTWPFAGATCIASAGSA